MDNGEGTAYKELALGKAIADARRKAGMTQQQLCSKANLSYSTLAKIERGAIKTPSIFTVAAIARATDLSIEALTGIQVDSASKTPQKAYKTSKNGIKFVYFDVNGVLVRFFQRAFTNIASDYNVAVERVESIFWQYNDRLCKGEMSLPDFNKTLANSLGSEEISWSRYYLSNVEPIAEMDQTLKWATLHYRVGLLTNNLPGITRELISRKIVPDIAYDSVIDSSEVGCIKPEKQIFDKAVQTTGLEPSELLLIDDSRPNIMAARQLGWHVLWFDDYNPEGDDKKIRQILEF